MSDNNNNENKPNLDDILFGNFENDDSSEKTLIETYNPEGDLITDETSFREHFEELKTRINKSLQEKYGDSEYLDSHRSILQDEIKKIIKDVTLDYISEQSSKNSKGVDLGENVAERIYGDMFGMGPLEPYLNTDSDFEDITIKGPFSIFGKRKGKWEKLPIQFTDNESLLDRLNRAIAHTGEKCNFVNPIVDAALPVSSSLKFGGRIEVRCPPVTDQHWPSATIRIPRASSINLEDMRLAGMLSQRAVEALEAYVEANCNIAVIGATGSGKTTLTTVLVNLIDPYTKKVVTIEDTKELLVHVDKPDALVISNVTREAKNKNLQNVDYARLIKGSLRMTPDWVIVGEARDGTIYEYFKMTSTGHCGMTTFHATSIEDFYERLTTMLSENQAAKNLTKEAMANFIAKSIDVVIHIENHNGKRYINSISELTGEIINKVPESVKGTAFEHTLQIFQPEFKKIFAWDDQKGKMMCLRNTTKSSKFTKNDVQFAHIFMEGE